MSLGFRASLRAIKRANPTTIRSTVVFRTTEIAPRIRNCKIKCPLAGETNCGINDKKKSAVFGLRTSVAMPCRNDNPEGVDASVFDGIQKAVAADRYVFFTEFFKNFYNTDLLLGKRISERVVQASWNVAAGASATATLACVPTWREDFRPDLARVDVPTLVIHGKDDRIVPFFAAGDRTAKLVKGAGLVVGETSRAGWLNSKPKCICDYTSATYGLGSLGVLSSQN
jgi:hypothetical protein